MNACELEGKGPAANPSEEVTLGVSVEFMWFDFGDGSFVDDSGRDELPGDKFAEPCGGGGVVFVVEVHVSSVFGHAKNFQHAFNPVLLRWRVDALFQVDHPPGQSVLLLLLQRIGRDEFEDAEEVGGGDHSALPSTAARALALLARISSTDSPLRTRVRMSVMYWLLVPAK